MTDREALIKAVGMLTRIGVVAGGFISKTQRAEIEKLELHVRPYLVQAMLDNGWTRTPDGGLEKRVTHG